MSTTARAPIWVAKLGLKVVDSTYLGGKIRMYDENEKRYRKEKVKVKMDAKMTFL